MVAIDGAPFAGHRSRPDASALPLPEVLPDLTSEFFVEWQVADHWALASAAPNREK